MATPVTASQTRTPAPQRMGFDPLRPVRYSWSMAKGATVGLLDGISTYGRKGFWSGIGLGMLGMIAVGSLTLGGLVMCGVAGLAAAGVIGGTINAVVGGYRGISLSHRREKYADEVAERQEARALRAQGQMASTPGYDAGGAWASRQSIANRNFERQMQQERENDRDYSTYWQDRVSNSHGETGRGF